MQVEVWGRGEEGRKGKGREGGRGRGRKGGEKDGEVCVWGRGGGGYRCVRARVSVRVSVHVPDCYIPQGSQTPQYVKTRVTFLRSLLHPSLLTLNQWGDISHVTMSVTLRGLVFKV